VRRRLAGLLALFTGVVVVLLSMAFALAQQR
jgi:hypothetical protein